MACPVGKNTYTCKLQSLKATVLSVYDLLFTRYVGTGKRGEIRASYSSQRHTGDCSHFCSQIQLLVGHTNPKLYRKHVFYNVPLMTYIDFLQVKLGGYLDIMSVHRLGNVSLESIIKLLITPIKSLFCLERNQQLLQPPQT